MTEVLILHIWHHKLRLGPILHLLLLVGYLLWLSCLKWETRHGQGYRSRYSLVIEVSLLSNYHPCGGFLLILDMDDGLDRNVWCHPWIRQHPWKPTACSFLLLLLSTILICSALNATSRTINLHHTINKRILKVKSIWHLIINRGLISLVKT